ncbi:MAG: hypothetical protein ABSC25_21495 [Roseiarcus sp.]|jgi:hypothetical protein
MAYAKKGATAAPPQSKTISAAEIGDWLKSSRTPALSASRCEEVAERLNKMRWPSDPPPPDSINEAGDDRWWDFRGATKAAMTLRESLPAMLAYWEGQRWAPETRGGYDAIKALSDALDGAMPFIEWPFGVYERRKTPCARRRDLDDWHFSAILIFKWAAQAMLMDGRALRSLHRNSVVVKAVHRALVRMGFPNMEMVTESAIAKHLSKNSEMFGLQDSKFLMDGEPRLE